MTEILMTKCDLCGHVVTDVIEDMLYRLGRLKLCHVCFAELNDIICKELEHNESSRKGLR